VGRTFFYQIFQPEIKVQNAFRHSLPVGLLGFACVGLPAAWLHAWGAISQINQKQFPFNYFPAFSIFRSQPFS
jgi:hypothetical protein